MKRLLSVALLCLLLASCGLFKNLPTATPVETTSPTTAPTSTVSQLPSTPASPTPFVPGKATQPPAVPVTGQGIPNFDHVVLIMLENKDYSAVIGSQEWPHLNQLAQQNVLLTSYFAVSHPSLPNYIALVSGSTQNIHSDCMNCFVNQPNLADEIEASGRTWKAYEESMPSPCFFGDADPYAQKHNPFFYFDSIRLNTVRCNKSIAPLTQLDADLQNNSLPNFSFIMPNLCDSAHDCSGATADTWTYNMVSKLQSSPALGKNSLIIVTFDEAAEADKSNCCGLNKGGGQVATILISPDAKKSFADSTPYDHYSLLKTILAAWNLPDLGDTKMASILSIQDAWRSH